MDDIYPWLKALHIISVIAWLAGLLYLPRLFVYHCRAEIGSLQAETFKVMERRLLKVIMNPSMMFAWAIGLTMASLGELWREPWMNVKFFLALILTATHVAMGRWQRAFSEDRNLRSEKFFRFANEIPTVLMIVIVILAVVKPW